MAFGVGVIFCSVGKKLAQGKFSVLSLVFVILEQLVIRFALNVGPGALEIVSDEYQKMAAEIIGKAREAGITLPEGDVKKIIEEARQHPQEIKQAYEMMKSAFEEMKKTPVIEK